LPHAPAYQKFRQDSTPAYLPLSTIRRTGIYNSSGWFGPVIAGTLSEPAMGAAIAATRLGERDYILGADLQIMRRQAREDDI